MLRCRLHHRRHESDPSCWSGAYVPDRCCNTDLGPRGDESCWASRAVVVDYASPSPKQGATDRGLRGLT